MVLKIAVLIVVLNLVVTMIYFVKVLNVKYTVLRQLIVVQTIYYIVEMDV